MKVITQPITDILSKEFFIQAKVTNNSKPLSELKIHVSDRCSHYWSGHHLKNIRKLLRLVYTRDVNLSTMTHMTLILIKFQSGRKRPAIFL